MEHRQAKYDAVKSLRQKIYSLRQAAEAVTKQSNKMLSRGFLSGGSDAIVATDLDGSTLVSTPPDPVNDPSPGPDQLVAIADMQIIAGDFSAAVASLMTSYNAQLNRLDPTP